MVWRLFRFFLFQLAGALLGYVVLTPIPQPAYRIIVGIVAASLLWVLSDLRRGHKLRRWLREGDVSRPPVIPGYWG